MGQRGKTCMPLQFKRLPGSITVVSSFVLFADKFDNENARNAVSESQERAVQHQRRTPRHPNHLTRQGEFQQPKCFHLFKAKACLSLQGHLPFVSFQSFFYFLSFYHQKFHQICRDARIHRKSESLLTFVLLMYFSFLHICFCFLIQPMTFPLQIFSLQRTKIEINSRSYTLYLLFF